MVIARLLRVLINFNFYLVYANLASVVGIRARVNVAYSNVVVYFGRDVIRHCAAFGRERYFLVFLVIGVRYPFYVGNPFVVEFYYRRFLYRDDDYYAVALVRVVDCGIVDGNLVFAYVLLKGLCPFNDVANFGRSFRVGAFRVHTLFVFRNFFRVFRRLLMIVRIRDQRKDVVDGFEGDHGLAVYGKEVVRCGEVENQVFRPYVGIVRQALMVNVLGVGGSNVRRRVTGLLRLLLIFLYVLLFDVGLVTFIVHLGDRVRILSVLNYVRVLASSNFVRLKGGRLLVSLSLCVPDLNRVLNFSTVRYFYGNFLHFIRFVRAGMSFNSIRRAVLHGRSSAKCWRRW